VPLIIKIKNPAGDSSRLKYDDGAKEWWEGAYAGFGGVRLNQAFDPREAIFNYQGIGGTGQYGASSYHGQGANFAICDGSIKYITNQIDTWQLSDQEVDDAHGGNEIYPSQLARLYQWLYTRNGGEPAEGVP
jgi:hypothetical protein